jgi:hypothetical protein
VKRFKDILTNNKTNPLNLDNGIRLGAYLVNVQEGKATNNYFGKVRTETDWLRYILPNSGNTDSWYEIVGIYKDWLLKKLKSNYQIQNTQNNNDTIELDANVYDKLNKIFNLHRGHNLHNFLMFNQTNHAEEFAALFKRQVPRSTRTFSSSSSDE